MESLIVTLAIVGTVAAVSALLIAALGSRPETPEARAERDARLYDELGAWN